MGISSDPAVATPAFHDSQWAVRDAQSVISDVPDEDERNSAAKPVATPAPQAAQLAADSRRYAWFRIHIELGPNHPPLALLLEVPVSMNASFGLVSAGLSPDVFADGRQIVPEGPHANSPQRYPTYLHASYDL